VVLPFPSITSITFSTNKKKEDSTRQRRHKRDVFTQVVLERSKGEAAFKELYYLYSCSNYYEFNIQYN